MTCASCAERGLRGTPATLLPLKPVDHEDSRSKTPGGLPLKPVDHEDSRSKTPGGLGNNKGGAGGVSCS